MGPQPEQTSPIPFGPFEFDGASGDLRKFGTRIRLQGKPVQILALLIEQPGRVVSREELQRHLWQDTTFVDFEQGLNAAVNKLRQALGDSADQARYIETVPGKGYRFVGPIQRTPPKPVFEIASVPVPSRPERGASRRAWIGGVAVAAAVALSFWLGAMRGRDTPPVSVVRFTVPAPAGYAFEAAASRQSFALSPDGTKLAFTAMNASGAFQTFLRDFGSLESRPILGEGAHTLFWSADGQSLYVAQGGKLFRAPLQGDAHAALGDVPARLLSGAARGPQDAILSSFVYSTLVPSSGGKPQPLDQVYRWPQMLPGGDSILYVEWDEGVRRFRAYAAKFGDPSTARPLIHADSRVVYAPSVRDRRAGFLLFVQAGNLMAQSFDPVELRVTGEPAPLVDQVYTFSRTGAADFSVSETGVLVYYKFVGRSQLAWVDRAGRPTGKTIGPSGINVKSGRLSPDGRRVAAAIYDVQKGFQDLWIFDVEGGAGRRLSSTSRLRDAAVWSPDGRRLVYLNNSGGTWPGMSVRAVAPGDGEEAMPKGEFQMPTDWTPDGRFVAFSTSGIPRIANDAQGDVWVVDMTNRGLSPLLKTGFHEANATFSPDGKWLAFTSNESGRNELYVQRFEGESAPRLIGERFAASNRGSQAVRWRRDGRELFYLGQDGQMWAVPIALGPRPQFGPATALFTIGTEARAAIHSIVGFDVSADGQRFLIPVVSDAEGPSLVVVQNWEAGLPR